MVVIDQTLNRLIYKLSENDEKYTSQFPKTQGDVFQLLVLVFMTNALKPKHREFVTT